MLQNVRKFWSGTLGLPASVDGVKSLFGVSLYRNAMYLITNYAVLGLTGFFFWIAAARLYPTTFVGLASSAISAVGLLTLISTLGFDFALIRFLPGAGENKKSMITSASTISGLAAIAAALVFIAGINIWSPALKPLRDNLVYLFAFIIFALMNTLQALNAQCFVAARTSRYVMVQGLMIGLLRFIPLVLLVAYSKDLGIFLSWGAAVTLTVIIAVLFFLPRVYPGVSLLPSVRKNVVGPILKFSLANYFGNIFWSIPQTILPIMVVNLLGAEQNAYFYIGWSIAGVVFMVPLGASYSLLAEASHDEQKIGVEVKKSLKLTFVILVPIIILLLFLGNFVLLLFGRVYSEKALDLLRLLSVSALPLSLNYIYFTVRRIEKKMFSVILLTVLIAVATLVSSYFLMKSMGIMGAALGWLACQTAAALFALPYLWRRFFKKSPA